MIAPRESHRHDTLIPSQWVARFAHLIVPGTRVVDLACGHGRHALFFAARGAKVLAVDRDPVALATIPAMPHIETRTLDLEQGAWPFTGERFGAIVVVNYLHRPLFAQLRMSLADDGVLLYETFAMGNEAFGPPRNPNFLLRRDELLAVAALAPALTVIAFEQGLVLDVGRSAVVQRLAAVGAARAWPAGLV
ncbi:MAG: class I SAM-dependent methyltransferase [Casimicrobiaceae bacterium]